MALYGLFSTKNYRTCVLKIPGDSYCNQLSENMFKVCLSGGKKAVKVFLAGAGQIFSLMDDERVVNLAMFEIVT